MQTVEEYLRHAARSEELASQAHSEDHRAQIEEIARMWRELAKDRERLLRQDRHGKP